LHSSAFDDHHAIPTTAEITAMAHWSTPTGFRPFPANSGLQLAQILEVIKGHGLGPVMIPGDKEPSSEFTAQRFCSLVGLFIRSGYPVLVNGWLEDDRREGHTVCITGFRMPEVPRVADGEYAPADDNIEIVYVHDDNLGPNARFRIRTHDDAISLVPESPEPQRGAWPTENPTTTYHEIVPTELIVAVHQELRTDPLELQRAAERYSADLPSVLDHETKRRGRRGSTGMVISSRFIRLHRYVEDELGSALRTRPPGVLSRARLALWEKVGPMSLHIGLVRVGLGVEPMMDILFDTSDNDRHLQPTAHVAFQPQVPWLLERWKELINEDLDHGKLIRAW
jgi:hypothetical protein